MRHLLLAFALCCAAALAVPVPNLGVTADLNLLTDDPRALCLDGSSSGFYFKPALSASSSRKFVINLEGGGECVTKDDCIARSKTDLGSSKGWPASTPLSQLQSHDCSVNIDFCDWNQVFVKYCSGDLWSGRRMIASNESFGLHFTGHLNLQATLDRLKSHFQILQAEMVVFTGTSAGGIGTFLNLDFVAKELMNVPIVGIPIAGFYFPTYCYTGPGRVEGGVPFTPADWPNYVNLWQSFVPSACAEMYPGEEWRCMMANFSYPALRTSVYIVEAQTDSVQMSLHDCMNTSLRTPAVLAFMQEWSKNMTSALYSAVQSRPDFGLFTPACLIHTTFQSKHPLIEGFGFYQGIQAWLDKSKSAPRILADDCGILCNPTCPK